MIRKAKKEDKKSILKIYQEAQAFIKTYNSPQWQDGYPNEKTFLADLDDGLIYVNEIGDEIVSVASFLNYEPTYEIIDGKWLNDEPYLVIHRIATRKAHLGKGYAKDFLNFAHQVLKAKNIRIDTHELNEPMKKFLQKNGFVLCGKIMLFRSYDNVRLAYHKVYEK